MRIRSVLARGIVLGCFAATVLHARVVQAAPVGWIDGGYFRKIGGANFKDMQAKLRPAQIVQIKDRPAKPEEMFQTAMLFILDQHKLVKKIEAVADASHEPQRG